MWIVGVSRLRICHAPSRRVCSTPWQMAPNGILSPLGAHELDYLHARGYARRQSTRGESAIDGEAGAERLEVVVVRRNEIPNDQTEPLGSILKTPDALLHVSHGLLSTATQIMSVNPASIGRPTR